jgi:biotin transport system substrate-specific component
MNINLSVIRGLTFQKALSSKIVWILSFSLLTAIAAQITIPVKPVPFTFQTMMVLLAGAFLGRKNGAYSQLIYLGLGAIGLPVFAHVPDGAVGIARLIGPTGGYLLAFPLAAFIVGHLIKLEKSFIMVIASMFLGEIIILLAGVFYLDIFFLKDFSTSLQAGAVIFIAWTFAKVVASASIYFGIKQIKSKK